MTASEQVTLLTKQVPGYSIEITTDPGYVVTDEVKAALANLENALAALPTGD